MEDSPASKRDIGELRQDIADVESRLAQAIRETETNLLKAFYGYAESTRQRLALAEGTGENLVKRMAIIEERIFEIEKRLNLPPAA